MTSRVSFLKLITETLRRHLAAVLITALVFVLHLITFFLNLQNTIRADIIVESLDSITKGYSASASQMQYIIEAVTELCSPNLGNAILAMLVGAFLAFDFFRYLHSKKETDFYESLPIKKETRFVSRFLCCFGIFVLLCTVTIGIELAIVYGTGFGSTIVLQNMLWNILCMIGAFLACWATTALAMIMTGHPIIAFLGVGVFATYIPLILYYLFPAYASRFFETYVSPIMTESTLQYYFSPVTLVYKAMYNWRTWTINEHWTYLLGSWIFAIIVGGIAYLLFLRRPSETAGRAMAFEKLNFIIRFLLVIPLSLYTGLFLEEMSYSASIAWLIFGIIFATLLLHGIIEAIFQFDIKAIISKKRQLLIAVIFSLTFLFIFWIDLFKYDDYMPSANSIKTVRLSSYMLGFDNSEWESESDGLHGEYVEKALVVIKELRKTDITDEYYDDIVVTYELKNGRQVKRRYGYNLQEIPKSLDTLYATEEFKDDLCVLYQLTPDKIKFLNVYNGIENFSLELTEEETREFIEIYLEEYTKTSLSQRLMSAGIYSISVEAQSDSLKHSVKDSYYVLPEYTNTIAFLKAHGVQSFQESDNIKLTNLGIHSKTYSGDGYEYISDAKQLEALRPYMMLNTFYEYKYYTEVDDEVYCELRYELNGATNYTDVYIKQSDIDKVIK